MLLIFKYFLSNKNFCEAFFMEKTINVSKLKLSLVGQDLTPITLHKNKFKNGDTVRFVNGRIDDIPLNGLYIIGRTPQNEIKDFGDNEYYLLISLQNDGNAVAYEEELQLVLSVEDLIKVANSNRM